MGETQQMNPASFRSTTDYVSVAHKMDLLSPVLTFSVIRVL
jgi:hypothetical protein